MTAGRAPREEMLAAIPRLRAFAISLCGNVDKADDLVQETLQRALSHIDSYQPDTNMLAWLITIPCSGAVAALFFWLTTFF